MLVVFAILGILATAYAIYVEWYAKEGAKRLCDVSSSMSCTVVLSSPYARLVRHWLKVPRKSIFNQPNTYYGILFYICVILYTVYPFTYIPYKEYILFVASSMSMLMSIVLACILYFKLKNFCTICATTWVINLCILYLAYAEIQNML